MKYTIFGQKHEQIETVEFNTLKELAQYLNTQHNVEDLCCVEDLTGWAYNPVDLVEGWRNGRKMKSFLVYQLGYDAVSDQEYLIEQGLFVVHDDRPEYIKEMADKLWGTDWFGLSYQPWDCNDLEVEGTRIFRSVV